MSGAWSGAAGAAEPGSLQAAAIVARVPSFKGKGKGKVEPLSLCDFKQFVDEVVLCRDMHIEAGVVHAPYLAKVCFTVINADRLHTWLLNGLRDGGTVAEATEAFQYALDSYKIDSGWWRVARSTVRWFVESEISLKPRWDFPNGIPFASHSEDWTGPDPHLPQPDDIMWHDSETPRPHVHYERWQTMLRVEWRARMGCDLDCACPESHHNWTRGMWICGNCHGDMRWRHQEPPCVHSGADNKLCSECSLAQAS